ncbi:hypothetical protein GRR92_02105 [Lactococcus lactis subsp. lactis]|uniref:hypothetical protein n=1 Tax=Lactococcus lactis TaxID=1358 RepID=UPI0003BA1986|nr:hypothetical protein [Lactococcus lactis]AGY45485.1 hypothetical protein P620_06375 [Lactococcus lactis subsp. lactis KLDS 4.0325]MBR8672949.1 hypothetical protein [Lactococcus lactis subsp. lactis]MBR8675957.1 hypothetical protein [Lactococcus lactis subsp. lactis]MBR8683439.1 hypothetical protein [Lactococcus lactis subsp. lactis]TRW71634.1 hypothetical protein FNJ58_01215 [Lactococcus lactis]
MGRPNQYYTVVEPKLEDIKALRKQGLSLEKIAQKLDLKLGHLTYYRKSFPDLDEVLNTPRDEVKQTERSAYFNRQKNYNSLRSFIRTQSTPEEREEYFHLILEKADKTEIEIYEMMIAAINNHKKINS